MAREVKDYATMAWRWWAAGTAPHGEQCPCLPCADCRAFVGKKPLIGTRLPPQVRRVS